MKPCTKPDFRMYSPLVGPAEEICWTCGVAKDKHEVEYKTGHMKSGASITEMVGLAAWLPKASTDIEDRFYQALQHQYRINGDHARNCVISVKDFHVLAKTCRPHADHFGTAPTYMYIRGPIATVEVSCTSNTMDGVFQWY